MTNLFTPFSIANKTILKNRFVKSAMSEQLANAEHNPTLKHSIVYKTWAEGGTALLFSGNLMIDREHIAEPKNVVLDEQSDLAAFRTWTKAAKSNGCQIWAQICHPGKQIPSALQSQPKSASAIALKGPMEASFNPPKAMTDEEVRQTIKQFATTARLAKEVGFQGVQVHGAHGFLVTQFLSPQHNQRDDHWGGTAEKRLNFIKEIVTSIRDEVGDDFPLAIKLNSGDFMKEGLCDDDAIDIVKKIVELSIDLVEISGGTFEAHRMIGDSDLTGKHDSKLAIKNNAREAYFIAYADKLRRACDVPLILTGGFCTGSAMQAAVEGGSADFIGLARGLCMCPDAPNRIEKNSHYTITYKVPSTGIHKLDITLLLGIAWFEHQISLLAKGKPANPNLGAWSTVIFCFRHIGAYLFNRRRR